MDPSSMNPSSDNIATLGSQNVSSLDEPNARLKALLDQQARIQAEIKALLPSQNGVDTQRELAMLNHKHKILTSCQEKSGLPIVVLSAEEECRLLQYKCECLEATCLQSRDYPTVNHLFDQGALPLESVQPAGFEEWLRTNAKEYDPILTAKASDGATQHLKYMPSLKCSELECIHYIYGFHGKDDLESHKRQHHKILKEPTSSLQAQTSLSQNTSEPLPGTGQQQSSSPLPNHVLQRNQPTTATNDPFSAGSRPRWEFSEGSAVLSRDINPRGIPNTVQITTTPYSAPAPMQPVAEEVSNQNSCDAGDPCSLCPEQDSLAEGDYWKVLGCYRGPLTSLVEILIPDGQPIQDQYSRDPPPPAFAWSASRRFIANWKSKLKSLRPNSAELKDEFGLLWLGNAEARSQGPPLIPPAYVLIQTCGEGSSILSLLRLSARLSVSRKIELKHFHVLSHAKDMMREAFIFNRSHQSWSKELHTQGFPLYDRYSILHQCARNFLLSFDNITLRRSSLDPQDWIATFCALCFLHASIYFLGDGVSLARDEGIQWTQFNNIGLQSVYKALVSTFMWSTPSLLDDEAAFMPYESGQLLSSLRLLVYKDLWEEHGIQTTKDFLMELANGGLDLISTFYVRYHQHSRSCIRPESAGIRIQSPEISLESISDPRVSERNPGASSNLNLEYSTSGNVTLEGASTANTIGNKPTYQKPKHDRVYCKSCEDYPDGFRGEHELRRHEDREHKSTIKKWICVQPTDPGSHPVPELSLPNCKSCLQLKSYGAYYNAAAHLRRAHFKPKAQVRPKNIEQKGGNEGGDWPPMSELKHWLKEIEEPVEKKRVPTNEERFVDANEGTTLFSHPHLNPAPTNTTTASNNLNPISGILLGSLEQRAEERYQASPPKRCPYPDCGRQFTNLKAHMITHYNERPEKCPITSCEYHTKGFARKYDKNRHTLSHYRGVVTCPFCPGVDTPTEKTFSRADVLKRHLTSVHRVDQTPPNMWNSVASDSVELGREEERKGKCSICKKEYSGPQAFYEHLNDCVLAVIAPAAIAPAPLAGSPEKSSVQVVEADEL
ncbi:Transcriptional regulator [Lachnellula hyalina]|uniref:Transcriptional regulator n=1 Tax=Lachnellula hyalina TaxID=1316788 RepID=A0A8H8QZG1_9HELO|nr:Transcriptional regulator [Lachnellula hyalina]TVY25678.1 Transcriptional regulator [Lachnellula hyalina]